MDTGDLDHVDDNCVYYSVHLRLYDDRDHEQMHDSTLNDDHVNCVVQKKSKKTAAIKLE